MFDRLQGDFYSQDGVMYTVTISVDDLPGLTYDFDISSLEINYTGDDNDIHTPILSSTCNIAIEIANSSINSVFSVLNTASEETYKVKIEKAGSLYWCGLVITDNVTIQDSKFPYTLNISAVDAIGRLKDIDYTGSGSDWEGDVTVLQHIYNILSFVPTDEMWAAGDVYFSSHIQMFSIGQVQTASTSPLPNTRISHRVFRSVDTKGVITYKTAYEVLVEISRAFASRFYHAEGRYNLEQVNRYASDDSDITVKTWNKSGTATTDEVYDDWGSRVLIVNNSEERIAGNADLTKRSGGVITYHAPLRSVKVTYNHFSTRYTALTLNEWTHDGAEVAQILDYDSSGGDYRLNLSVYIQLFLDYSTSEYYSARAKFRATISVNDGTDTYYLSRPASYDFGVASNQDASWSTDVGYYEFYTSNVVSLIPSSPASTTLSNIVNIDTPAIPVSGDISISFEFVELQALNSIISSSDYTYEYLIINQSVSVQPSGVVDSRSVALDYVIENTETTNTEKVEIEFIVGDGPTPNSFGRFTVWNGSAWTGSGSWHDLGSSSLYAHGSYIAKQILTPRLEPNERLEGGIIGAPSPCKIIERSGKRYILGRAKLNLGSGLSDGVWTYITDVDTKSGPQNTPVPLGFKFNQENPFLSPLNVSTGVTLRPALDRIAVDTGVVYYTNSLISVSGGVLSSLSLTQRTYIHGFFAGDTLNIVHPNNGYSQQLVVDATDESDKVIPIEDFTPDIDYPIGSLITLSDTMMLRLINENRRKLKTFQLIPYYLDVPIDNTPVQFDQFFRVPAQYNNYRVSKITVSVHTAGTGSVNFVLRVTKTGSITQDVTHTFTDTQTLVLISTYWELSTGDLIEFFLQSTTATTETRPKGLTVTLEIIATLL